MNQEEYQSLKIAMNSLETAADELLNQYCAMVTQYGLQEHQDFASAFQCQGAFEKLYEDVLNYKHKETWSFGGYECHTFELPVYYLWDDSWKNQLCDRLTKINESLIEYKKRESRKQERVDKELLNKLIKKYGYGDQPKEAF